MRKKYREGRDPKNGQFFYCGGARKNNMFLNVWKRERIVCMYETIKKY